jgi:hypothetical protein
MKKGVLTIAILSLGLTSASAASAHIMPWREGEPRTKAYGQCAKGPCLKRADYSRSKPHHHHGGTIVVGSERHVWECRFL